MAKIVEATGVASGSGISGREIEQAMAEAVTQAMADGITDPDQIRELQLAARAKIRQGAREKEADEER